uniref:Uncharacterized protein n=1 Tax=Rhizophora mucronata TaxID=61149 RepID=A0A2P2IHP1_RHIMU
MVTCFTYFTSLLLIYFTYRKWAQVR